MGHYTNFADLAAKYEALAEAGRAAPRGSEGRRQFTSLRRALPPIRAGIARLALKKSRDLLRAEIYEQYIPSREEYARLRGQRGTKGKIASLKGSHRRLLRVMRPEGQDRAWRRFGVLFGHEQVEHGEDAQGQFIRLFNDAKNKKGGSYAGPRKDLGTAGHRKNSVWTRSLNWQMQARMDVRPEWLKRLHGALQRVMNQ